MSDNTARPGSGGTDDRHIARKWSDVPEADRPVWARYMLDYCPWFPGATIMTLIASGVVGGGTHIPSQWQQVAVELHNAGFTPIQYFLLAELLSEARRRGDLDKASHGHLFKQWYGDYYPDFRLDAEAWKPWLERLEQAQSPRRALEHMLHGPDLPPLGMVTYSSGGPNRVVSD